MVVMVRYIYFPTYKENGYKEYDPDKAGASYIGTSTFENANAKEVLEGLKYMSDAQIPLVFDNYHNPMADISVGESSYYKLADIALASKALSNEKHYDEPSILIYAFVEEDWP